MAVRGLHGKPVVRVIKMRPPCLEDKNAFGQDPELQWPHTHTHPSTVAFPLWLILFSYSSQPGENMNQKLVLAHRGFGLMVAPEPQQHNHPFWIGSNHGQASYTTCYGQSLGAPVTAVSSERLWGAGEMGLMGTSQPSVFPWGQQDMEFQVIAGWHQLRSFLAPKLHQPEK